MIFIIFLKHKSYLSDDFSLNFIHLNKFERKIFSTMIHLIENQMFSNHNYFLALWTGNLIMLLLVKSCLSLFWLKALSIYDYIFFFWLFIYWKVVAAISITLSSWFNLSLLFILRFSSFINIVLVFDIINDD